MDNINELYKYLYSCKELFSEEEINTLNKLESNSLEVLKKDEKFSAKLIPIFDKIGFYSLGSYLDDNLYELLKIKYGKYFDKASDNADVCSIYFDYLDENNCKHPTFLKYKNFNRIGTSISTIFDYFYCIMLKNIDYLSDTILSFEEKNSDLIYRFQEIDNLFYENYNSVKDINKAISSYNFNKVYKLLLVQKNNQYDNSFGLIYDNQESVNFNIDLNDLMIKLNKYLDYSDNSYEQDVIKNISEIYTLYYLSKYYYLLNDNEEKKLLKKCNKL